MNKTGYFIWIALLLLLWPLPAQSQTLADRLERLTIDFWPDYDEPNVLILLTGTLPAGTPLPAEVVLPKPPGGTVHVVARITPEGGMIDDIAYTDEGNSIRLTLPEQRFRVEYYVPYTVAGNERSFAYTWLSPLAVDEALAAVQQPVAATNLVTQPTAVSAMLSSSDGFIYHALPAQAVPSGQPFSLRFDYTVLTPRLSVENLPSVQGGETAVVPLSESETNWLLIISGAAVVVAALGLTWVVATQRAEAKNKKRKPQPRRAAAPKQKAPKIITPPPSPRFCHECGNPLRLEDRFCRECGTAVRKQ